VRLKLDENIGRNGVELLKQAGHDVTTVPEQALARKPDEFVFQICVAERRTLITSDRDFGQLPRSPPANQPALSFLTSAIQLRCVYCATAYATSSHSPQPVVPRESFGL
jgi:predicted nuclease of predicted toxin-antitoxin system